MTNFCCLRSYTRGEGQLDTLVIAHRYGRRTSRVTMDNMVAVISDLPQRIGRTLKVTFMVGNGGIASQVLVPVTVDGSWVWRVGGVGW